jgi:hypothetical protein
MATTPPITPPGHLPLAAATVPAPPEEWTPAAKTKRSARGLRPRGAQTRIAAAVAEELAQAPSYADHFGSHAPDAKMIAFLMTNAVAWRDTWHAAKKLLEYATEQRATWENAAMEQMEALKPPFEYVASRDHTVAETYAATAKYLGETRAIAVRGARVRKAKAKAPPA